MLIGILHGAEETFPVAFVEEINARGLADFRAEPLVLEGARSGGAFPCGLVLDRISHRVPYYRAHLKAAVLSAGTRCINDPFRWERVDRFLVREMAAREGGQLLPSVLLPSRSYPSEVDSASLRNLAYPLPWDDYVAHTGFPARLVPVGGNEELAIRVNSLQELWEAYNQTGQQVALLERWVDWEVYRTCLCIGERTFLLDYDPVGGRYLGGGPAGDDVEQLARALCARLGVQLAAVEFGWLGGVPYVTNLNPFPDLDWWTLSEAFFGQVVGAVADLVLDQARVAIKNKGGGRIPSGTRRKR